MAFYLLTATVLAGAVLALWHLRATDGASRPPRSAGLAHGVAGAAGFLLLLPSLFGPPRGVAAGAGSFGDIAGVLFALALLTGVAVLLWRATGPAVTMTVHAGIAITAYVMLVAWYSVG